MAGAKGSTVRVATTVRPTWYVAESRLTRLRLDTT